MVRTGRNQSGRPNRREPVTRLQKRAIRERGLCSHQKKTSDTTNQVENIMNLRSLAPSRERSNIARPEFGLWRKIEIRDNVRPLILKENAARLLKLA